MSRSAPSKINPNVLNELGNDTKFVNSISTNRRLVKIDKGQMWRVRFLPAELGPKKLFFVRAAQHWMALKPLYCPRQTSEDYGGNPEAYCPICDYAQRLTDSVNQAESELGNKIRPTVQWITYCVVFEKDGDEQSMADVLIPYEFRLYKATWEELKAMYKAGGSRSALSILDFKTGNDIIASRTTRGIKLDKQDPQSIFDLNDPRYPEWIKKIQEGCKPIKIKMPTEEEQNTFLGNVEAALIKLERGSRSTTGGRGRSSLAESDDLGTAEEHDEPERPRRAAQPESAEPPDDEAQAESAQADDQIPGAEVPPTPPPAPRKAPAPAARTSAPATRPASTAAVNAGRPPAAQKPPAPPPAPTDDPEPPADGAPESEPQPEPEPEPEPEPDPTPAASARGSKPAAAASPRRAAGPPQPQEEAEQDNLPLDETADKAPPVPMGEDGAEADSAPPPPPPTHRTGTLGSAIANRMQALKKRGL